MKRKMKLYLAHNLEKRHEVRKLELEIEREFDIELHNPFYDSGQREDIINLDNNKSANEIRNQLSLAECEAIVDRDLNAIDNSDGTVAIFLDGCGIGTCLEMAYTRDCNKLLIFISEKYYNHPWIRIYADYRFKTIDEFKIFLKYYKFNPIIFKLQRKIRIVKSAYMIIKIGISKLQVKKIFSRKTKKVKPIDTKVRL